MSARLNDKPVQEVKQPCNNQKTGLAVHNGQVCPCKQQFNFAVRYITQLFLELGIKAVPAFRVAARKSLVGIQSWTMVAIAVSKLLSNIYIHTFFYCDKILVHTPVEIFKNFQYRHKTICLQSCKMQIHTCFFSVYSMRSWLTQCAKNSILTLWLKYVLTLGN